MRGLAVTARWLRRCAFGMRAPQLPLLAAALCLLACERNARAGAPLVLSAAADLALALPALTDAFTQETGITVTATVGASGMLAQQILNGAPVDVFAAADRSWIDRLATAERIVSDTRATYALGSLALVVAPHVHAVPGSIAELRDDAAYRRIAIANPAHAPYGLAARAALQASGVWRAVEPRIVIGENVRQALQYVLSGDVDAALVARALLPEDARWLPVPHELHAPLSQDIVVIRGTAQEPAARRFVEFMTRGTGRAILSQHHFTLPGPAR